MSATGRGGLHLAMQEVFNRASPDEQAHYLELMRHDPVAGIVYLEALGLKQQRGGA